MNKFLASAAALTVMVGASPALAQNFTSTFENVPGGPGYGGYTTVYSASGWTSTTNGIELQNHVAGDPAASGGNVFVELDTFTNSSMSRTLNAGTYSLSFLYSPRPGYGADTNGIEVLLNGISLYSITGVGGNSTDWSTITLTPFVASAGSTLTFAAIGTGDGVGGYIDNITAVPEPATWAMMLLGFGMVGVGLRTRRNRQLARVTYA